jgi:hypothetical protein
MKLYNEARRGIAESVRMDAQNRWRGYFSVAGGCRFAGWQMRGRVIDSELR